MTIEHYLIDLLSPEYHQSYVKARQEQGMDCITDYHEWLKAHTELAKLQCKDRMDRWDNSKYNIANHSRFSNLDDTTKRMYIAQGKKLYWDNSTLMERQIAFLDALLTHPDEIKLVLLDEGEGENEDEEITYWFVD